MMDNFESTSGANKDVWHVQLSTGELRVMTLDQLDEAFHDGVVSENTFIYQAGMNDWIKLGDLAGLDGDEESATSENAQPGSVPVSRQPAPPPLAAPVVLDRTPTAPAVSAAPAPLAVMSIAPPPSFASAALMSNAAVGPNSMAPLASDKADLEFDSDMPFRRKSSRGRWGLAIAAVAGLGVVGVVAASRASVFKSDGGTPAVPPPALGAQAMLPLPSETPPVAAKLSNFDSPTPRMNDDTKKALLEADKVRAAKNRARQRAAPAATPRRRPAKSAAPFHKGGDAHDPLNSSL
jgi:hypothetical protein